jgi:hypothetical protein
MDLEYAFNIIVVPTWHALKVSNFSLSLWTLMGLNKSEIKPLGSVNIPLTLGPETVDTQFFMI